MAEASSAPDLAATITCPLCATRATATMPTNACQHLYSCSGCGETLRPRPGDCCVFCSYADSACPPKQAERLGAPRAGTEIVVTDT